MTKMTRKEKYELAIAIFTKDELTEDTAMLVDFFNGEIAAIDRKAAKAKERKAAKEAEADGIYDAIWNVLNFADSDDTFFTIPAIIEAIGDENLTPSKVTPRLTTMIKEGLVEKKSVTTADKRRLNGYAVIRA